MKTNWKMVLPLAACLLAVVMMASYAEAMPTFGNSSCSSAGCHVPLAADAIDVTGTVPPTPLDPPSWGDGGGRGPLEAFVVAPGGTVTLSGLTLGTDPGTNAALELKRFYKKGDTGDVLEPHVVGGSAGWTPINDGTTGALYYYQYITTTRGPFSFDLTVDASTKPGIYDLEFAVAGSAYPNSPVGKWYDDEHFYLNVVPEPGTFALLAMGLGAFGLCAWRRRKLTK